MTVDDPAVRADAVDVVLRLDARLRMDVREVGPAEDAPHVLGAGRDDDLAADLDVELERVVDLDELAAVASL